MLSEEHRIFNFRGLLILCFLKQDKISTLERLYTFATIKANIINIPFCIKNNNPMLILVIGSNVQKMSSLMTVYCLPVVLVLIWPPSRVAQ